QNAIDGSLATRWSCAIPAGGACWIQPDLGSTSTVTGVNIAWYQGSTRTNTFKIAVSNDASSFTTVWSGTSSGKTTALETYSFGGVSGRYVRISVSDSSLHNGWASITEIQVLGSAGTPPPPPPPSSSAYNQVILG